MPRVLVLTCCTARKHPAAAAAEALYTGEHHRRLMRGVAVLRRAGTWEIDLRIVSAQHGLIDGQRRIAPYDATFAGQTRAAVRARALALAIPADVHAALATPTDLAIVALGEDYLTAAALDTTFPTGGPTLVLSAPAASRRVASGPGIHPVIVGIPEARRFACGFIALKGEVVGRLLSRLATSPEPRFPDWVLSDHLLDRLAEADRQLALAA